MYATADGESVSGYEVGGILRQVKRIAAMKMQIWVEKMLLLGPRDRKVSCLPLLQSSLNYNAQGGN